MYIEKCWGNYIGGTDDSLNLLTYLKDCGKETLSLHEIFVSLGLAQLNGAFQHTTVPLKFIHSSGMEMGFDFAIDLVTDLAALLLECKVNGSFNLRDLDEYEMPDRTLTIVTTPEELAEMDRALQDFAANPLSYDLSEMVPEPDMLEMADICAELHRELMAD